MLFLHVCGKFHSELVQSIKKIFRKLKDRREDGLTPPPTFPVCCYIVRAELSELSAYEILSKARAYAVVLSAFELYVEETELGTNPRSVIPTRRATGR